MCCDWRTGREPRCPTDRKFPFLLDRKPEADVVVTSTMATEVRQELSQLMNSSGSHKDLAAKYVRLLCRNTIHSTWSYARSRIQKVHYIQLPSTEIAISSHKLGEAKVASSLGLRYEVLVWIKPYLLKYSTEKVAVSINKAFKHLSSVSIYTSFLQHVIANNGHNVNIAWQGWCCASSELTSRVWRSRKLLHDKCCFHNCHPIIVLSLLPPFITISIFSVFLCVMFHRYRQILDKAIQFTDADQLESLKAFVEASMQCPLSAF